MRLNLVMALVALCSAATTWALHGHTCTGDGCVLCLATALANAFLFASIGITFVLPVVRVLVELRALHVGVLPRREWYALPMVSFRTRRAELTPVTMGVRLII